MEAIRIDWNGQPCPYGRRLHAFATVVRSAVAGFPTEARAHLASLLRSVASELEHDQLPARKAK